MESSFYGTANLSLSVSVIKLLLITLTYADSLRRLLSDGVIWLRHVGGRLIVWAVPISSRRDTCVESIL